jgi:hypothetical protein
LVETKGVPGLKEAIAPLVPDSLSSHVEGRLSSFGENPSCPLLNVARRVSGYAEQHRALQYRQPFYDLPSWFAPLDLFPELLAASSCFVNMKMISAAV